MLLRLPEEETGLRCLHLTTPEVYPSGRWQTDLLGEMIFRYLFSALIKKSDAVEKLAESRPMRRAAQLTAYAAIKAQLFGKDAATKVLKSNTVRQIRQETFELPRSVGDMGRKAGRLKDSLVRDVKDGVNGASRQIKRKGRWTNHPKLFPTPRKHIGSDFGVGLNAWREPVAAMNYWEWTLKMPKNTTCWFRVVVIKPKSKP